MSDGLRLDGADPSAGLPAASVLELDYLVRSYEVEASGELRLVTLLRMLQEAAWRHASLLGKGFTNRSDGAWYWVLSRLRVKMDTYPRWGEQFTVRTFPVGTERLLALREFVIRSAAGTVIGSAATGWLIVDGGTGRPVRPERIVDDLTVHQRGFDGSLARLDEPGPGRTVGPFPVRRHDIDQYHHVNNASYLEWVLDALDPSRTDEHRVAELGMDFLGETRPGDGYLVRIDSRVTEDRFEVARESDGKPSVRGCLRWVETDAAPGFRTAVDHPGGRR